MALFRRKRILFYAGCVSSKLGKQIKLYMQILEKLGIKCLTLTNEICCGAKLYELGYEAEARKLARKNLESFRQAKIDKLIVVCPDCYKFFLQYSEILPDWPDIEIEHISVSMLGALSKIKMLVNQKAVYLDDSSLVKCKITKEPRELVKMLGYELVEVNESCSGMVNFTNQELATKINKYLLEKVKKIGKIITTTDCYLNLKQEAEKQGVEILELSEVVAYALGVI